MTSYIFILVTVLCVPEKKCVLCRLLVLLQRAYLEGELEHSSKKQSGEESWKLSLEGFRVALGLVDVVVGSGCGCLKALGRLW